MGPSVQPELWWVISNSYFKVITQIWSQRMELGRETPAEGNTGVDFKQVLRLVQQWWAEEMLHRLTMNTSRTSSLDEMSAELIY